MNNFSFYIDEINKDIILNEIKIRLEEDYLLKINNIEKISESTDNNVCIVYTNNKKYVIKIYTDIIHTKNMVDLHRLLIKNGLNIPKIINTKRNNYFIKLSNNTFLVVYSFLDGTQLGWASPYCKLNNSIISQIAVVLKKLHSININKNDLELPTVPYIDKNSDLQNSILHFDLTKNNIFVNEDGIGIIDFDDAKYGPSICDVAILLATLFFSKKHGVNIKGAQYFIDEYYKDIPERKIKELPLIKKYALDWIDYILGGNEFDTSTNESFIVKKELIKQFLLFIYK